jgi:hypothetical protein
VINQLAIKQGIPANPLAIKGSCSDVLQALAEGPLDFTPAELTAIINNNSASTGSPLAAVMTIKVATTDQLKFNINASAEGVIDWGDGTTYSYNSGTTIDIIHTPAINDIITFLNPNTIIGFFCRYSSGYNNGIEELIFSNITSLTTINCGDGIDNLHNITISGLPALTHFDTNNASNLQTIVLEDVPSLYNVNIGAIYKPTLTEYVVGQLVLNGVLNGVIRVDTDPIPQTGVWATLASRNWTITTY